MQITSQTKYFPLSLFFLLFAPACASSSWKVLQPKFSALPFKERQEALLEILDFPLQNLRPPARNHLIKKIGYLAKQDPNEVIRACAIDVLAYLGKAQCNPYYLRGLRDEKFIVRYQAIKALQKYGTKTAIQPLLAVLEKAENFHCRREAAKALAKIGEKSIVPQLIQRIDQEENIGVRYAIHKTLEHLTKQKLPFLPGVWKSFQIRE
ncbi:MAG: HEAT repeat domain-containing protein [Planctomycetota bacterium]|nr:MAG: HEAT repeat domain-containing protein [Planctomycetota bacterium]